MAVSMKPTLPSDWPAWRWQTAMRPMAFRRFTVTQATQGLAVSADAVALALIAGRRLQARPRRAAARPLRVLDVGTGTAVIALVLRQLLPTAAVGAIELDEAAFAQVRSRVRRWPPSKHAR